MADITEGAIVYMLEEGTGRHAAGTVKEATEDRLRVESFRDGEIIVCRKDGCRPLEMKELGFDEVAELWLYEKDMEDEAGGEGSWPERSGEPVLAPSMEDTVYLLENIIRREVTEEGLGSRDMIESALESYVTYCDGTLELITPQSGVRWAMDEIMAHLHDIPYLTVFRDRLVMLALFFDGEEGGALPRGYIGYRFGEIWRSPLAFSDDPEELGLFLPEIMRLSDEGDGRASWFLGKLFSDPYWKSLDIEEAARYLMRVGEGAERAVRGDAHCLLSVLKRDHALADRAIAEKSRKAVIVKAGLLLDDGRRDEALSLLHSFVDSHLFSYLKGYTFPEILEALHILYREERDPLMLGLWRTGDGLISGTDDIDAATDRLMDLYIGGMLDREQLSQNLERAAEDAEVYGMVRDELEGIGDAAETAPALWDSFRLNFRESVGLTLKVTVMSGGSDITVENPDNKGNLFPFFFDDGKEILICDSVRLLMDDGIAVGEGGYTVDGIGADGEALHRGDAVLARREPWSDMLTELSEFDRD